MSQKKNGAGHGKERLVIRQMTIDDLAPVFHLGERLFTSKEAPNLYRTWDEFEILTLFSESQETCLVAQQNGELAGFALGTTISKVRSAWKYGYLVWLGVAPRMQRKGVARRLFGHLRQVMLEDGIRMILVDTEADNESGIAFFKRMGFGRPEQHVYLTLNLSSDAQHRRRPDEAARNGSGPAKGRRPTPTRT